MGRIEGGKNCHITPNLLMLNLIYFSANTAFCGSVDEDFEQ